MSASGQTPGRAADAREPIAASGGVDASAAPEAAETDAPPSRTAPAGAGAARAHEGSAVAARAHEASAASGPVAPPLIVGAASSDVDVTADSSRLPGQHRGGFSRLPTAPIAVTVPSGPREDGDADWAPASVPQAGPQRGLAAWALGFAALGLIASMFVGWGFPVGMVAVVTGILALRRPTESRAVAGWAVVLGTTSLIYSAGWLWFAATQTNLLG